MPKIELKESCLIPCGSHSDFIEFRLMFNITLGSFKTLKEYLGSKEWINIGYFPCQWIEVIIYANSTCYWIQKYKVWTQVYGYVSMLAETCGCACIVTMMCLKI